jgi:ABC-2 type transport system permease protein
VSAALVFANKEVREIVRTWRIWVLPGIILVLALTGPVLARYTPEIVGALAGSQLGHFTLPTPTYISAYAQWLKNLNQIVLIALVIIFGGIVSSETSGGTAILVLTKPLSRGSFVVVKAMVQSVFLAVLLGLGTLVTWAETAIVFGKAPAADVWQASLTWLVLGVLMLCAMVLFSVLIRSAAGAAGAGLGLFVVLSVASLWKPLAKYSPAGLSGRASDLAGGIHHAFDAWPIVTSLALSVVLVAAAATVLRRQEL